MKQFLKLPKIHIQGHAISETVDGVRQAQKILSGLKSIWFASVMQQSALQ
jgi:hypothetical protein